MIRKSSVGIADFPKGRALKPKRSQKTTGVTFFLTYLSTGNEQHQFDIWQVGKILCKESKCANQVPVLDGPRPGLECLHVNGLLGWGNTSETKQTPFMCLFGYYAVSACTTRT
jgi:hypothetical protein